MTVQPRRQTYRALVLIGVLASAVFIAAISRGGAAAGTPAPGATAHPTLTPTQTPTGTPPATPAASPVRTRTAPSTNAAPQKNSDTPIVTRNRAIFVIIAAVAVAIAGLAGYQLGRQSELAKAARTLIRRTQRPPGARALGNGEPPSLTGEPAMPPAGSLDEATPPYGGAGEQPPNEPEDQTP